MSFDFFESEPRETLLLFSGWFLVVTCWGQLQDRRRQWVSSRTDGVSSRTDESVGHLQERQICRSAPVQTGQWVSSRTDGVSGMLMVPHESLSLSFSVLVHRWCIVLNWGEGKRRRGAGSVLPEGRAAGREPVPPQHAPLVPADVASVHASDSDPPVLWELECEVLGGVAIAAHKPCPVHVPEETALTWRGTGGHQGEERGTY